METSVASRSADRRAAPLLGLRRQPGRLALAVFRLPLRLYRGGGGWLPDDTFLLLAHAGRKTGQPYSTVATVLRYDPHSREVVICSAWGKDADWIRNIQIGRESFTPGQRFDAAARESVSTRPFVSFQPVSASRQSAGG